MEEERIMALKKQEDIKKDYDITVLHMGAYDLNTAHDIRKRMHELYHESYSNPAALFQCFDALKQFYIVFKWAMNKSDREVLDNGFKKIGEELDTVQDFLDNGREDEEFEGFNKIEYRKLRLKIEDLIDRMYKAKQLAGLGVPKEHYKGARATLKEDVQ
jgi:hypothetical protein